MDVDRVRQIIVHTVEQNFFVWNIFAIRDAVQHSQSYIVAIVLQPLLDMTTPKTNGLDVICELADR